MERRPIKERGTAWARGLAKLVAGAGFTPNQISVFSVVLSIGSALAMMQYQYAAAAALIGGRLLCNMIDGMVAVEHNRCSPSGEIFNELPDRLSDTFSLLGLAYASDCVELGLWTSLVAVLTAYIRTLSTHAGAPADFGGPMAKQQRMKLAIAALLICQFKPEWHLWLLPVCLQVILALGVYTCWRRASTAVSYLENHGDEARHS
jgi:phosphatidylglycerophosphate synthase